MTKELTNLQKLREIVLELTYSEMMMLASWFANTDKLDGRELHEESFWAHVINDWANNAEFPEDEEFQQ